TGAPADGEVVAVHVDRGAAVPLGVAAAVLVHPTVRPPPLARDVVAPEGVAVVPLRDPEVVRHRPRVTPARADGVDHADAGRGAGVEAREVAAAVQLGGPGR